MKKRKLSRLLLFIILALVLVPLVVLGQGIDEKYVEVISSFIQSPIVSGVLIGLGLIGLVIEIITPGISFWGILSILSFSLYFGSSIALGNLDIISIILFISGLVLILIEIMVPGFGLPGIGGTILLLIGLGLGMDSIAMAVYSLGFALLMAGIVVYLFIKFGLKETRFGKIVLDTSLDTERGVLSNDDMTKYLGKEGKALTNLRPAGFIELDGVRLDGLSQGELIKKGSKIVVEKVEGYKIFVRRI